MLRDALKSETPVRSIEQPAHTASPVANDLTQGISTPAISAITQGADDHPKVQSDVSQEQAVVKVHENYQESAENMQVDTKPQMPKFKTKSAQIAWRMKMLTDEAFL